MTELKKSIESSRATGRGERHFYQSMKVDMAHTVMLTEQKILSREEGSKILRTLKEINNLGPTRARASLFQVEDYLKDKIGEDIGGKMHTGRSRIDRNTAIRRLYKRDRLLDVIDALIDLQKIILKVAEKHSETIMPGYTHMQHAQPWIFGHYLLSFYVKFNHDFHRIIESYARVNLNPLGTVGLAGTSWPLDRDRTTELLGFGGLVENSKLGREAYYAAEAIAMLSMIMADLNDLATDLHIWSTYEFRLLECSDEYCGISSIFPQKKNPYALERIKSAAGPSINWFSTALCTFRAEGTGDQAMRSVPIIDDALKTTEDLLVLMGNILDTLIVHEDRMKELVRKNWSTASNLADFIVKEKGLSFRVSHHIVSRLVRVAIKEGTTPLETTGDMLAEVAKDIIGKPLGLTTDEIRNALDPEIFVITRVTKGSINPNEVERMLVKSRHELEKESEWIKQQRESVKESYDKLEESIKTIIRA